MRQTGKMFRRIFRVRLLVLALGVASSAPADAGPAITMGIVAGDAARAGEEYGTFVGLFGEKLGAEVALAVFADAEGLGKAAASGVVDILMLSPTDYVMLHETAPIEAIATKLNKGGTPYCQGTIVTRSGSGVKSIGDLKGKTFRFGPKGTFNKYYAAVHALKEHGVDADKDLREPTYGVGCDGIAESVLSGEADAGVVCDYSWNEWVDEEGKDPGATPPSKRLTVIGKGPRLRDDAVAAAGHVDAATREKVAAALVGMKGDPRILAPPLKARGFSRSTDADYDDLRELLRSLQRAAGRHGASVVGRSIDLA